MHYTTFKESRLINVLKPEIQNNSCFKHFLEKRFNAHFNTILILISTIFVSVLSRTFFVEKVSRFKNLNVALIFRKILTIERSLFRAALRSAAFISNNFHYNLVILTRCAIWNKMIGRLIFCCISEYIRKKIYITCICHYM